MKFAVFALFVMSATFAAKEPTKVSELRTRSIYGDRDVRFLVKNDKGKISIERMIDGGNLVSRSLKTKEWDFLVKEFKKLPQAEKIPLECGRARMEVTYLENGNSTNRNSCFGIKTITSESYQKFAQMLALAF